jgi:hypothetical protein
MIDKNNAANRKMKKTTLPIPKRALLPLLRAENFLFAMLTKARNLLM